LHDVKVESTASHLRDVSLVQTTTYQPDPIYPISSIDLVAYLWL
jgi:hypothetical protein